MNLQTLMFSKKICVVGQHSGAELCVKALRGVTNVPIFFARSPFQTDSSCLVPAEEITLHRAMEEHQMSFVCAGINWVQEALHLVQKVDPEYIFPPFTFHTFLHYKTPDQWKYLREEIEVQFADAESKKYWRDLCELFTHLNPFVPTKNSNKRGHYGYDLPIFQKLKGKNAIDIGAWIGDDCQEFIDYGCETVYAVEPTISSAEIIKAKQLPSVIIKNHAAGNYTGRSYLSTKSFSSWNSIGSDLNGEQIQVRKVDHGGWGDSIGIIKAEPEGADIDVLLGMLDTIKWHKPIVCITAYHDPFHVFRILNIAKNEFPKGYRVYAAPKTGYSWQIFLLFVWEN